MLTETLQLAEQQRDDQNHQKDSAKSHAGVAETITIAILRKSVHSSSLRIHAPPKWDSIAVLTNMPKFWQGFKAVPSKFPAAASLFFLVSASSEMKPTSAQDGLSASETHPRPGLWKGLMGFAFA